MKYAIVTFGCRVNQADSLDIERHLRAQGAYPASADEAELVVVNTCSVTAVADHGARQVIRRIARKNPRARIVATGCYATRAADDLAALSGVAAVVPNSRKSELVRTLLPLVSPPPDDGSAVWRRGRIVRGSGSARCVRPDQLHASCADRL